MEKVSRYSLGSVANFLLKIISLKKRWKKSKNFLTTWLTWLDEKSNWHWHWQKLCFFEQLCRTPNRSYKSFSRYIFLHICIACFKAGCQLCMETCKDELMIQNYLFEYRKSTHSITSLKDLWLNHIWMLYVTYKSKLQLEKQCSNP